MVVVLAFIQLEDRGAALEVMALDERGRLELRQHAIDGREADVLALVEQRAVDVFGRQVATMIALARISRILTRGSVTLSPALRRSLVSTVRLPPRSAAIPL